MDQAIRVGIIDDHTVAREGLRSMLETDPDIRVTGEADSAAEALRLLRCSQFDVLLLDIGLPDKSGLEVLKQIREVCPDTAVLVVSAYAEDVYAVRALKLGAAGYLTKHCCGAALCDAVRKVAAGGKYVTPSLLQKLAGMLGSGPAKVSHESLTDRELEIFRMIACGDSLVGIAACLHLSPSTVTTYRTRILDKMGMKSNADLTRYALDHGMLY